MEYNRPHIILKLTPLDKALDVFANILLIILIACAVYFYTILPDIIPIHFDINGAVNGRGSKNIIWLIVGINVVLFFGLCFLAKRPHLYNYPAELTLENTERQYRLAARLIRTLRVSITLTFVAILFFMYQAATELSLPYAVWQLPAVLSVIFIPILVYFFMAFKK